MYKEIPQQDIKDRNIKEKMNDLIDSISEINDSISKSEVIQLKYFLNQIATDIPNIVHDSLTKERFIDKKRSLIKASSSLSEAKRYLTLLETFGYGKTNEIKSKVDEFNDMLAKRVG